ncbi:hypothetical protein, partial [Pseudomonas sp. 2822-17]|uniref:hypothetical protein n=1 Tax=Pseudomonas sp. 2822-17 TaxID=1712678 RepID=UPI001C478CA4
MNDVLVTSNQVTKQGANVASTRGQLASVANSIDRRIVARRGIGARLNDVDRRMLELERRFQSLG